MSKAKVLINPFSPGSIADAIDYLKEYKAKVERAAEELPKALAEVARESAQAHYDTAPYNVYTDGTFDKAQIVVETTPIENGTAVVASGEEVAFVEFGAGVWYNGEEGYFGTRPEGIVGIGEYGQGKGNQRGWGFTGMRQIGVDGKKIATHGTPASNSLYFAMRDAEDSIQAEAEKILGDKVRVSIDD